MTSHPNSLFTQELADTICLRISDGESLNEICRSPDMPCKMTVMRWVRSNEDFRDQYIDARNLQADHYADEIVRISDQEEDPHRARVRVDARKWVASKLRPQKYGDRVEVSAKVDVERVYSDQERVQAILLALREANVALPLEVKADE